MVAARDKAVLPPKHAPTCLVRRTTLDNTTATQYAALATHLSGKTRMALQKLRQADGSGAGELEVIRIRSKKHENIIAPEFDKGHEFQLIVVQNPNTAP